MDSTGTEQSRNGVEPFEALNQWTTFSGGGPAGGAPTPGPERFHEDRATPLLDVGGRHARCAQPGCQGDPRSAGKEGRRSSSAKVSVARQHRHPDTGIARRDRRSTGSIDQATRAGVVIYSLDARGLQTAGCWPRTISRSTTGRNDDGCSGSRTSRRSNRLQPGHPGGHGVPRRADGRLCRPEHERPGPRPRADHRRRARIIT